MLTQVLSETMMILSGQPFSGEGGFGTESAILSLVSRSWLYLKEQISEDTLQIKIAVSTNKNSFKF